MFRKIIKLMKKNMEGRKLTSLERDALDRLLDSASLVITHGKDAAIVLAGRGIGPRTAARILSRMNTGEDLLQDILKAERQFARTKRFWRD